MYTYEREHSVQNKRNTLCRAYNDRLHRRRNTVCREVQVQCAEENKYSVQMRRNAVFRGVQIQCAQEQEQSVQRNRNTVCRGVKHKYSMQRRSWRDWYLTSGDSSQGAAPAGDPTQHTCSQKSYKSLQNTNNKHKFMYNYVQSYTCDPSQIFTQPILSDGPTVHHPGHSVYVGHLDHPGHPGYPVPVPISFTGPSLSPFRDFCHMSSIIFLQC